MEASKFGFGPNTPPAFKLDPTDADLVAYYLLPRALGLPNPYAHAVFDDDPGSVPPWELLHKHGDGELDHAFFFGPPTDSARNGGRKKRTIKGVGLWQGQKGSQGTVTLVHPGGGELDITFKRYDLTFYRTKGGASTGYIMHEYELISPPLPGTVLRCVKINKNPKKEKAPVATAAGEQPGMSYEYDAPAMASNSKGFSDAQAGALYGGSGGDMADTGCYYTPLKYAFPEGLPVTDQPGASYNAAAAMRGNSQGFTGAQAYAFSGGGMVETDGAYYDPSPFVPVASGAYNSDCGQYQEVAHWPYQLAQIHNHSQYMAGHPAVMRSHGEGFSVEQQAGALSGYAEDAAMMCSGDEGLSGGQQAGALCGYSVNGSVMPTESGHSTPSLCDGGEENGDGINDVLFRGHDGDFNFEQSDDEISNILFGDKNVYFS